MLQSIGSLRFRFPEVTVEHVFVSSVGESNNGIHSSLSELDCVAGPVHEKTELIKFNTYYYKTHYTINIKILLPI